MDFIHEMCIFYQEAGLLRLIASQVFPAIPLGFLIISVVNNFKLTRVKVEDRGAWWAYQLGRLPYLVAFIICNAASGVVLYPVMRADMNLKTNFLVDILLVVVYLSDLFWLLRLEAGLAVFMHLACCLPIMFASDKYLNGSMMATKFVVLMLFSIMVLFCPLYWSEHRSPLAKKYLGVDDAWDLEDK